ncbi:MAG TPA: manganese efflux pump [Trebonia sp.]|nr:manganese efflux pump [Trebonia sp.]
MLALLLVAVSLGLSNFAASIGIGVTGVDARTRLRVGLVFGAFEAGMPVAGLLIGHGLAAMLGGAAHWTGAGLLIATGLYGLAQSWREKDHNYDGPGVVPVRASLGRMLATGLALSVDNLAVGFALGAYRVSLPVAAVVIGAVSVALSLLGLELGSRIGTRAGQRGELIGAIVLIAVGIAIAAGVI